MSEELVNPYDIQPPETGPDPSAPLVNPYVLADNVPDETNSERAAAQLQNLPMANPQMDPVADFAGAMATGIVAPIAAGAAGWAGKMFGAVPGGETSDDKGDRWYEATRKALTYEPMTRPAAAAMQGVGNVMGKVEGAAKYVGSGYAALGGGASALAKGDFDQVGQAMGEAKQNFRETPNAMAEGMFQVTGSPTAAVIFQMLPELASMGFVKPNLRSRGGPRLSEVYDDAPVNNSMRPGDVPEGYGGVDMPEAAPNWSKATEADVPEGEFIRLRKAVQAKDAEQVAEIINANPAIVAAFDELGIKYMPQMVTDNAAVRYTASGLKTANPQMAAVDNVVGRQLKELADELINEYGSTDRMSVDQGVRQTLEADIDTLAKGINQIYDDVLDAIPPGHQVDARGMTEYIENRVINELGGGDLNKGLNSRALSKHERDLWDLTHQRTEIDGKPAWETDSPTYAEIDAYRRDVGDAFNNKGVYADNRMGEVKKTYAQLAETQQRATNDVGPDVGQAYKEANELGVKKHQLQEQSQELFGKNLDKSLVQQIDMAANAVVKGNTAGFKKMMDAVPEAKRKDVAMSVLDRIMTGSAGSEEITRVFLKNINLLNRNPSARNLLFSYLPKEAIRRYQVIEKASKGFLRSRDTDNKSMTAFGNNVVKAWEDGSLWKRLLVSGGEKVPMMHEWVTKISQAGPANRVAAAEKFLTSPALDRAARLYADGKMRAAENAATRSAAYRRWFNTLDDFTKDTVTKDGVMAYLFTMQVENKEDKE